jgi:hypothetical protein
VSGEGSHSGWDATPPGETHQRGPGQPRKIAIAAYAEAGAGALLAVLGLGILLLLGDIGAALVWILLGAVMVAFGAGIYFHNGIARVLAVIYAIPAGFLTLVGLGFTAEIWYALLADVAVLTASALVLYAVASTANWVQLMGWDR